MVSRREKKTRKKLWQLNPSVLVILSFVVVIFVGSVLLTLPIAQTSGKWGNYMDALFTAFSATCVTGLCTYKEGVAGTLTFFGQLVLLIMIQIGGLGFITLLTFFITTFTKKIQFRNRYLLSQMVNSTNFADVAKFVRRLIFISILALIVGTLLGLPVFFTIFPHDPWKAIWNSFFTATSAFNNAGFDLFGTTSLFRAEGSILASAPKWAFYYLCSYIMILIVFGGISFLVILDVFAFKKIRQWRTFTKVVLSTTGVLLFGGWILFIATEVFRSGGMTTFDALFQSVTLRTAGFATYNQDNLTTFGKVFSCFLMFIGGSPLSTAGGIKTTTAFMIFLAVISYFSGRHVTAFKRTYSANMTVKAMSLVFLGVFAIVIGFVAVMFFEKNLNLVELGIQSDKTMCVVYEVFSAFGTVGVSTGITPFISVGSKIVLCLLMFLGRLGPITFLQIFQANMDKKQNLHYDYVEEDFLIG